MTKPTSDIQPRLNRIDFYRLHGSEFFEALFQCIDRALGDDEERLERWALLNPDQQGLYAWSCFQGEVQNGGLAQFFYNRSDAFVPALGALLNVAGCQPVAALLERATALYHQHRAAFDVENPFGEHGLFASMTEMAKLDSKVERLLGSTGKTLEKWVRASIAQIAAGDDGQPIDASFTGTVETHHPGGAVLEQAAIRRGKLSGPYRRYSEDGTLEFSCYYKAGEITADYWPDGTPRQKKTKRGDLTVHEWYYPSGQLQKRYVANKGGFAAEPVRLWHENGQLAEEVHVKGDRGHGPWLKFFDDGSPRLEAENVGGPPPIKPPIIKNAWDDQKRQVVKDGNGTYFNDGLQIDISYDLFLGPHWTHSSELRGGVRHGRETTWHEGVLWRIQEYADGKPHGQSVTYYNNGRVRTKATYRDGEEVATERFPRFDDPRPAVVLEVRADAKLYTAWKHPLLDSYPTPLNLDEIQAQLEVPRFLEEVFERNRAGTLKERYEDFNTFDDGVTYMVMVDEHGAVDKVNFSGASPYSIGTVELYPPMIRQLRFDPGRIGGRDVRCRVVVSVRHTFVEGRPAAASGA